MSAKFEVSLAGETLASFASEEDLVVSGAARVAELDAMARREAGAALRHALEAGAILLAARSRLPHGGFLAWLSSGAGGRMTPRTAQNYMRLAEAWAERKAAGGGGDAALDDKPLTRLYMEYGIVRRTGRWGGQRPGAGRPAAGADAASAAVAAAAEDDPDLNWAEGNGYLKGLREFGLGGDGFGTLRDDDLESAVVVLSAVAERARALLAARRGEAALTAVAGRAKALLAERGGAAE